MDINKKLSRSEYYQKDDDLVYSDLSPNSAFKHLNVLIEMAESSHSKINRLNKELKKLRKRTLTTLLIAYALIGVLLTYTKEKFIFITLDVPFSYIVLTGIIIIGALLYILFNFKLQRKDLKVEIEVEQRILKDILELSFDIKKILGSEVMTHDAWVAYQVLEMRLRRLNFS
ncbi:TPA: hypothetical protein ACJILP_000568 [Enterobacter ludwigii]